MALESGTELEQFVLSVLDRQGVSRPDAGVADGSIGLAKLGGVKAGQVTLTWASGAASSGVVTVQHGLGKVPESVVVTENGVGGPTQAVAGAKNVDADSFDVQATFQSGTAAAALSVPFGWVAVG